MADTARHEEGSARDAAADASKDVVSDAHDAGVCYPLPANAVSWWRGENNPDDSLGSVAGGLNPGLWTGTASYADGMVGQAFNITAARYVTTSTTSFPTGTMARTIELWARISTAGGTVAPETFFEYGTLGTAQESFILFAGAKSRLDFTSWDGGFASGEAGTLAVATWYHLAITTSGTMVRLYVNGANVASSDVTFSTPASSTFVIGGMGTLGAGDFRLAGAADEVTVYDRELSASEVAGIYAAGAAGKCL